MSNSRRVGRCLLTEFLVLALLPSLSRAEDPILKWVPPSCNTIAVIRVRELVNSPLGRRQKWSDKVRQGYAEGLLSAPPSSRKVVRATVVGPSSQGAAAVYSLYVMDQRSVLVDVAKHEMASTEKIAEKLAVQSPRGVFFVQLAPGLLGAIQPAERQSVSRWVRSASEDNKSALSPYIGSALETPEDSQLVLAIDLTDMLDPRLLKKWLSASPRLQKRSDIEELSKLMASLKGARLSIRVTDEITGRLQFHFGSPLGTNTDAVKAAILQWFDDAGARVKLLEDATASVSENTLTLDTPLDEQALRRVLSIIQSPQPSTEPSQADAQPAQANAVGSARYYEGVFQQLKSLDRRNQSAADYEKTAYWHETAANKIDGLSTAGVDPDLTRWGSEVSEKLRSLASSLRGVPVEVNELERSVRFDKKTYYRWHATNAITGPMYFPTGVEVSDNLDEVRRQQEDAVAKNADQRDAVWQILRDDTEAIAGRIETKYQITLEKP